MKTIVPISFRRLGKTRDELEMPRKRADELSLSLVILFLIALPLAALFFFPKTTLAVVGASTLYVVIIHFRYQKLIKQGGPPIPLKCPSCASEELNFLFRGLWDGVDAAGKGIGGAFHYALCKKCGSRCVQYEDGKPYVPSDEEWNAYFDPGKKRRAIQEKWPFMSYEEVQTLK